MQTIKKYIFLLALISTVSLGAQEAESPKTAWTLEQCIEYARVNNIALKRQKLNADYAKNRYEQSKLELLPSLNASSNYNMTSGKAPDPNSFQLFDVTIQTSNYSISSSVPVFQGLTIRNTIKKNESDWKAAIEDAQKVENDIALAITSYYAQVLFNKELLAAAKLQLETVNQQVERTERLVQAGTLAEGSLLEIKSIAAREALNVTQLENSLRLSLIDLALALNLESVEQFDVVSPTLPDFTGMELAEGSLVLDYALDNLPQIKAAEYRTESSIKDLQIAKGYLLPSLSVGAGWSTFVTKHKKLQDFDFGESFKDNGSQYVGFNLYIPIFNGLSTRTSVKNAKIGVLNSQLALEQERLTLRKEIQQASADADAAFRQYLAAQSAVDSYRESFRYTEKRYNVGMVNVVDYNVAKSEYMKAEADFLQAKYTYFLRLKILDFYQGKPIVL